MAIANHTITKSAKPYDENSALSIFEYSKQLLNKTLRDFLHEGYHAKRGKGSIGQMVENLFFRLDTNSRSESDFFSAGIELKCTPLKEGKNGNLQIKERLVCNMINYCDIVKEDFEESHFYLKCRLLLLLFYLYKSGIDNFDLKFLYSVLWKFPQKDLAIIKQDYETIVSKIKRGEAHLLSEGDTMYLGACRKGQKGDSLMKQPFSDIGAPRRAFSLKMSYMRTILQYVIDSKETSIANFALTENPITSETELKTKSFDKIILSRFVPYKGMNYACIARQLGINLKNNPKNKFAIIANAIVTTGKHFNANKSEEFQKAGLIMKTIRMRSGGMIKEAMSFENIDYNEVAECDNWFNSRLYELYSSRFLFVVYKEVDKDKEDYVLDNVFFWTMPQNDLNVAEEYWENIRENVLNDKISEEYWWKASLKKKFHVRPKARNSKDFAITPSGRRTKKFCYWFNNDYVREIVKLNTLSK